jgi:hypothetical protein
MQSPKVRKIKVLAERRMNEVQKKISLVGSLSHTGKHEYSEAHVKQILS